MVTFRMILESLFRVGVGRLDEQAVIMREDGEFSEIDLIDMEVDGENKLVIIETAEVTQSN